jgi:hypothetical protein
VLGNLRALTLKQREVIAVDDVEAFAAGETGADVVAVLAGDGGDLGA